MLVTESAHCIVGESNNVYNSDILKEWEIKKSYSINRSINSASTKNKHKGVIVWGMSDRPSLNEDRREGASDNQYTREHQKDTRCIKLAEQTLTLNYQPLSMIYYWTTPHCDTIQNACRDSTDRRIREHLLFFTMPSSAGINSFIYASLSQKNYVEIVLQWLWERN